MDKTGKRSFVLFKPNLPFAFNDCFLKMDVGGREYALGEEKNVLFNQLHTTDCVYYLKYGKTLLGVQSHSHPRASEEFVWDFFNIYSIFALPVLSRSNCNLTVSLKKYSKFIKMPEIKQYF